MAVTAADERLLARALELAGRGRRTAQPNPSVGCVITRDGVIVAEAYHRRAGEPHAEVLALSAVAGSTRGTSVYVTLEPCQHHGRTPPCAELLVASGVARVVCAAIDPAPWANGAGIRRLRAGGVSVDVLDAAHPLALRARREHAAHRTMAVLGRPHLTYKAAVTLDGRTATASGDARWISGPQARRLVHEWRAKAGAVLVGAGTALRDDPLLTARDCDPPADSQPLRVVFDRMARLPASSRLAQTTSLGDVIVVTSARAPASKRRALEARGVQTETTRDLVSALDVIRDRGMTSILFEGGATLAASLLRAGRIDRCAVFVAPMVIADPAAPGLFGAAFAPASVTELLPVKGGLTAEPIGPDILLDAWLRDPP